MIYHRAIFVEFCIAGFYFVFSWRRIEIRALSIQGEGATVTHRLTLSTSLHSHFFHVDFVTVDLSSVSWLVIMTK